MKLERKKKETLHQAISEEYTSLLDIAETVCGSSADYRDVCHSMIAELLELPKQKQDHIAREGYLHYYFYRMVQYSAYSKTSRYFRTNNPAGEYASVELSERHGIERERDPEIDFETLMEDVVRLVNSKCTDYEKEVFRRYSAGSSFNRLAKETGIPSKSLWQTYGIAKATILSNIDYESYRK